MNEQNLPKVGSKMIYTGRQSGSEGPVFEVTVIGEAHFRELHCVVIKFEDGEEVATLRSSLRPLPEVNP